MLFKTNRKGNLTHKPNFPYLCNVIRYKVQSKDTSAIRNSKAICTLFFRNVLYLIRTRGLTIQKVVRDIYHVNGYKVNRHSINRYARGEYDGSNTMYLSLFADYFGESVAELMSRDYEASDRLKGKS